MLAWDRATSPVTIPSGDTATVAAELTALSPPSPGRHCFSNLGPRFLLVYQSGDRTVGIVIDDYGCGDARLTSDPTKIVAGEDTTLTPGVLDGAQGLLRTLKGIVQSQRPQGNTGSEVLPHALDKLKMTLVLGKSDSGRISSSIRVENTSGQAVVAPGCALNNYSWGVVPANDPHKALSRRAMTRCTSRSQVFPPGYAKTVDGPTFLATRGPAGAQTALRPGTYLATIDFGAARSTRLAARIVVPASGN